MKGGVTVKEWLKQTYGILQIYPVTNVGMVWQSVRRQLLNYFTQQPQDITRMEIQWQ